ncbi:MAG: lysylphosphatidylglycerol synthase domain-containing protein [Steroidobacteraceae bacterium]
MSARTRWLLSAGLLILIGVLATQSLPTVVSMLALAGFGLVPVALYHLLPLGLDAAAIRVLFGRPASGTLWDALLARWVGESAGSLMPAGQIGGPLLMARHLVLRGLALEDAAASVIVGTTLQTSSQIGFALIGVGLIGAHASHASQDAVRASSLIASGFLALLVVGFYLMQRRGLFGKLMRAAARLSGKRDWSNWMSHAEAIDVAVGRTYRRAGAVTASFALYCVSWLAGTVEVYWILNLIGSPVGWMDALLVESVGQAIRGAAFAVPGALGVQEGGYVLLAALLGLPSHVGLALSLAKRTREILLGLPGLLYLHLSERAGASAVRAAAR